MDFYKIEEELNKGRKGELYHGYYCNDNITLFKLQRNGISGNILIEENYRYNLVIKEIWVDCKHRISFEYQLNRMKEMLKEVQLDADCLIQCGVCVG